MPLRPGLVSLRFESLQWKTNARGSHTAWHGADRSGYQGKGEHWNGETDGSFGAGPIGCHTSTLSKVQRALERSGIEFLDDGKPGVRLRGK